MKNYPKRMKNMLHSVIRDMAKHPENFCRCPEKDFTRNRKLPLEKLLTLLIKMGGHSLRDEMLDCIDFEEMPATVSALVQQRNKLLPEALEYLFREFTNRCHNSKTYKGYRLLAVDGSDLQFTANPNDPLSYFPGVNGQKPYSFLHLNALYDLSSNLYLDAVVQKRRAANENAALISMVDRSEIHEPVILTADKDLELEPKMKLCYHSTNELVESTGEDPYIENLTIPANSTEKVRLDLRRTYDVEALENTKNDFYYLQMTNDSFLLGQKWSCTVSFVVSDYVTPWYELSDESCLEGSASVAEILLSELHTGYFCPLARSS